MSEPITFSKGEKLAAAKLNGLSAQVQAGRISGNVQMSKGGALFGTPDKSNFIDALRPFDAERSGTDTVIVRGGAYQHTSGSIKVITKLTCDGGASSDPFDFITISPTIAASTTYYVYLELDYTLSTLTAKVGSLAAATTYTAGIDRRILTQFTTTADNVIPSFDPVDTYDTPSGYYYNDTVIDVSEVKIGFDATGAIVASATDTFSTSSYTATLCKNALAAASFTHEIAAVNDSMVDLCPQVAGRAIHATGAILATGNITTSGVFAVGAGGGATGTFISGDLTPKTITVAGGIIISIV